MIIAWAGQKGGAGKSTLAIATASELHRIGKKTLLVDADPQGTSATWGNVAGEIAEEDPEYSFPMVVSMGSNLHKQLPQLANDYEYIIVDCPGRIDKMQRAALAVADLALVPITPDTSDVWALSGSLRLLEEIQMLRPELKGALVLNKIRASTAEADTAREMLAPAGIPIFKTTLGQRVTFTRFTNEGTGVVEFEPKGKAANEVSSLVQEILTEWS